MSISVLLVVWLGGESPHVFLFLSFLFLFCSEIHFSLFLLLVFFFFCLVRVLHFILLEDGIHVMPLVCLNVFFVWVSVASSFCDLFSLLFDNTSMLSPSVTALTRANTLFPFLFGTLLLATFLYSLSGTEI